MPSAPVSVPARGRAGDARASGKCPPQVTGGLRDWPAACAQPGRVLRVPCYSSSPRLFLAFAIAVSGRLGFDFFRCLQLRPAERAKEQRMVDERRPRFLLIDEPDAQVNDFVRSDRDQWLEIRRPQELLSALRSSA